MSTTALKKEVESLIFESTIKGDSGFRKEVANGVMSQKEEDRRSTPSTIYIPSLSYRWDESGNQIPIRYIPGIAEIDISKQKAMGNSIEIGKDGAFIPSGVKILMKSGLLVLKNEGNIGQFQFIKHSSFNESAPNRPEYDESKKFYRVIEPLKDEEEFNDRWLLKTEATQYVASLIKKGANNSHEYKIDKIDALLNLFGQYGGENPAQKLTVLAALAETDSVNFLSRVKSLDDSVMMLITHAEELKVINIGKKSVEFVDTQKIVVTFDVETTSRDKKIKHLAELLKTPDYASKFQELQAAVDLKEKQRIEN